MKGRPPYTRLVLSISPSATWLRVLSWVLCHVWGESARSISIMRHKGLFCLRVDRNSHLPNLKNVLE
jgi:hypothetical protein